MITADCDAAAHVAVIVAAACVLTSVVLIVNVPVVRPAGIVTVFGAVADVVLLERVIISPPAGAIELMVTLPALDLPPMTEDGSRVSETSLGAVMVSGAVLDTPLRLPVIVATV